MEIDADTVVRYIPTAFLVGTLTSPLVIVSVMKACEHGPAALGATAFCKWHRPLTESDYGRGRLYFWAYWPPLMALYLGAKMYALSRGYGVRE
jgi:hypothetical protein